MVSKKNYTSLIYFLHVIQKALLGKNMYYRYICCLQAFEDAVATQRLRRFVQDVLVAQRTILLTIKPVSVHTECKLRTCAAVFKLNTFEIFTSLELVFGSPPDRHYTVAY